MPSARLHIGEIAQLLGITPKTIRHYHKLGLLPQPERSSNGYRLYGSRDLLRLQRIRRLQTFGLSLKEIKFILEADEPEQRVRDTFQARLAAVDVQLHELQTLRQRIGEFLAADHALAALEQSARASPTFDLMLETLGDQAARLPPGLIEQERALFAQFDHLMLSDQQRETFKTAAEYAAAHPTEYQALVKWGEKIATLADESEASPQVDRLAREFVSSEAAEVLRRLMQISSEARPPGSDALMQVVTETIALAPAQRRFIQLLQSQLRDSPEIKHATRQHRRSSRTRE